MQSITKMRSSLRDMEELFSEVSEGMFIPKRFRKISTVQFMNIERPKFLAALSKEILRVSSEISFLEKQRK